MLFCEENYSGSNSLANKKRTELTSYVKKGKEGFFVTSSTKTIAWPRRIPPVQNSHRPHTTPLTPKIYDRHQRRRPRYPHYRRLHYNLRHQSPLLLPCQITVRIAELPNKSTTIIHRHQRHLPKRQSHRHHRHRVRDDSFRQYLAVIIRMAVVVTS